MIDYLPMSFFYKTVNFQIKTRVKMLIQVNSNKDIQKGQWKFQSFHLKFVNDTV